MIFTLHYKNGLIYITTYNNVKNLNGTEPVEVWEELYVDVRRLARRATGNKSGVVKMVNSSGKTVWEPKAK